MGFAECKNHKASRPKHARAVSNKALLLKQMLAAFNAPDRVEAFRPKIQFIGVFYNEAHAVT